MRAIVIVASVLYVAAGLGTLHDQHSWGDDWAQYVLHARNIALGLPYGDTGYIFNPDAAMVGPALSQPGLPVLLSPVYMVFGENLVAFKAVLFVAFCASLPFLTRSLQRIFGISAALTGVVLFALHPSVLGLRQQILTEYPYILLSLVSIWLVHQRDHASTRGSQAWWALAVGLSLSAAYSTRVVALALLAAILVSDLLNRRSILRQVVPLLASFSVGYFLLKLTASADYTQQVQNMVQHQAEVDPPWIIMAAGRAVQVVRSVGDLFPAPFHMSSLSAAILLLLAVVGFARICVIRQKQSGKRATILAWAAACPLEGLYVGAYLSILIVMPTYPDTRLMLPVLPFILGAAAFTVLSVLAWTGTWRRVSSIAAIVAVAGYVGILYGRAGTAPFSPKPGPLEGENGAYCRDCVALYSRITADTATEARIAFAKPRAMALITGRESWTWLDSNPEPVTLASMKSFGINYLVVPRDHHILSRHYPEFLSWSRLQGRREFPLVYENQTFRLYRVDL